MNKKKLNFSGTIAFVLAILVLMIFVPINLIVSYYDKGFDMTPAKKYTLSEKTVELLEQTSDKHIDIYFLYKLEKFQRADASELLPLYHTLQQLDERSNITLTCFEPDENAALAKELDPEGTIGTARGDLFIKCNNVVKKIGHSKFFQQGTDGVRQYAGEELIAAAISTCASGSLPGIYFLTGHGEKSITGSLETYARQLKSNDYDVQELDLDKEGAIPSNAKIIYLAGPQEDITVKEKDLLCEYADNGGSLSFLIDPCDTEGRFYNIEAVMEKFGLILDYNIVTETSPANQLQDRDSKQSENFFRVEYPAGGQSNDEFTEDLTSDLNELVSNGSYIAGISYPRSVTEIPEDSFPGAAYTERSTIIRNLADDSGAYTTKSKSMGGDDITAQQADEMLSGMVLDFGYYSYNKTSGGKMVFIGTTSIIDQDMIAVSVSGTQMLALFSNTWLYDSDIQFGVGNKLNSYDYMIFKDSKEATSVMVIVYIIPAILAIFGIAVWIKRRNS
ncbi:MAG: GldG family protein [Ruminococcus sp.]|uniref:Gldg family protein n=1 Tax=Ruminococcus sp. TaxID=41978 RepID=UPI0025E5138D|nr:Gldg family protein [Ruminococcus sp.]MCR5600543.1 GldG family protein [Ruminococcus sp.]